MSPPALTVTLPPMLMIPWSKLPKLTYHGTSGLAGLVSSHGVQNWPTKLPAALVRPEGDAVEVLARVSRTFSMPLILPESP